MSYSELRKRYVRGYLLNAKLHREAGHCMELQAGMLNGAINATYDVIRGEYNETECTQDNTILED